MALYNSHHRDPLLDAELQRALSQRGRELIGLVLVGLGLVVALVLATYSPEDPSWMAAADGPMRNALGRPGAALAAPMMIIIGKASWGVALALAAWGLRMMAHRGEHAIIARVIFVPIAIAFAAVWLATLVPGAGWTHDFGLGGLFGDTVTGALLTALPLSSTASLNVLTLVLFFATVAIWVYVTGASLTEVVEVLRFLTIGLVMGYAGLIAILRGGAMGTAGLAHRAQSHMAQRRAQRAAWAQQPGAHMAPYPGAPHPQEPGFAPAPRWQDGPGSAGMHPANPAHLANAPHWTPQNPQTPQGVSYAPAGVAPVARAPRVLRADVAGHPAPFQTQDAWGMAQDHPPQAQGYMPVDHGAPAMASAPRAGHAVAPVPGGLLARVSALGRRLVEPELVEPEHHFPDLPATTDDRIRSRITEAVRARAKAPQPGAVLRAEPPLQQPAPVLSTPPHAPASPVTAYAQPAPSRMTPVAAPTPTPAHAAPVASQSAAYGSAVPGQPRLVSDRAVPAGYAGSVGGHDGDAFDDLAPAVGFALGYGSARGPAPNAPAVSPEPMPVVDHDDPYADWDMALSAPAASQRVHPRDTAPDLARASDPGLTRRVVQTGLRRNPLPSRQARAEAQPALQFEEPRRPAFELPPLALLASPATVERYSLSDEALEENARMLESVLEDYGVRGEIVSVRPGPVVTMYELEPAPGLKASRVIGLADDIARSMSALSARVSTVPGRSVIGIELPNARREKVVLREILSARDFGDSNQRLPLALGKDIGGEAVVANLAKMPHLLIAGTTGSGKSVAINTMILSLLYKLSPEECRLIMIDPKMLELSVYDGIPHLLSPVVTDPKKAVVALKWVVGEMEERYRKMSKMGVRNIEGFNGRVREALSRGEMFKRTVQTGFDDLTGDPVFETEEFAPELLPFIVVIVDEMADLMMVAGKEIEACIQRLAQMARASGIHLIMATQRPSVDVITGTIKANFPTRISFQVTSKIDSRTILGEQGAEQLLGMGDMLYMAGGAKITRVHGPFVSDEEVEEVVNHLKSFGPPSYMSGVLDAPEGEREAEIDAVLGLGGGENEDALYDQAVAIVAKDRKCSTSYIQRKLGIGYNKAAKLVEQMEDQGVVTPANHVGKREILVPET
jgi:S-DNA-T family DNA segregation ATPase FtsK/SpoIIIE